MQVGVQPPTSANNVALPAFAATRRAVVRLLLSAGINRSISPDRRAHSSKIAAAACGGRMGQTDRRTPYRYRDPASHMRAVPISLHTAPIRPINLQTVEV